MRIRIRVDSIGKYLLALLMMFLIIRPQFIITMLPLSGLRILSYLELVLLIIIALSSFNKFCSVVIDKQFIALLILYLYILLITRIQSGTLGLAIYNGVAVVCAVVYVKFFSFNYGYNDFIKYFNAALSTYIWINLLTMLIFPEGIVRSTVHAYNSAPVYFLGQVNQFSIHLILASVLLIIYRLGKQKFTFVVFFFNILPIILTFLIDVATTAIVAIGIMICGIILIKVFPNSVRKIERPILNSIIVVMIFFLISRLLELPVIASFTTNFLGKDITLASRTAIWEQAFYLLQDTSILLFGKGEISGSAYVVLNSGATFSAHNILLQICFISGLIGLALFCFVFYVSIIKIEKSNQIYKRAMLAICLLAFCLINMTEVYTFPMIYTSLLVFDAAGSILETEEQGNRIGGNTNAT